MGLIVVIIDCNSAFNPDQKWYNFVKQLIVERIDRIFIVTDEIKAESKEI